MRGHDLFRLTAIYAAVLCYCTILLGGTVMASGVGLSCPHWPTCYPNANLFPTLVGGAAIEWSHRVSAFFLSLSVLVLTILGVIYERHRPVLLRLSAIALALVAAEALLGAEVVASGLTVVLVLAHLAIATGLFGLLLVLVLLSNMRDMPRRWIEWARRASEETPSTSPDSDASPTPSSDRVPFGEPRKT